MPKPKMNLRILNESILRRFDQIESYQSESGHHRENARVDFNYAIPRLDLHTDVKLTREAKPSIENPRLGLHPDITPTLSHRVSCKDGDIWLAGSALLCSCPDCNAPMTIRVWLGLADCWRCQTSISLTEEQIHAVNQLTKNSNTNRRPAQLSTPKPANQASAAPPAACARSAPLSQRISPSIGHLPVFNLVSQRLHFLSCFILSF